MDPNVFFNLINNEKCKGEERGMFINCTFRCTNPRPFTTVVTTNYHHLSVPFMEFAS